MTDSELTDAPTPTEIRAPDGARRLEIDWADGETTAYSHHVLRGFCPCAHCQGHHGPVRWVDPADADLELRDLAEVGSYAVGLTWGDGHSTGIYTYRFLRALAEVGEANAEELEGRTFMR